MTISQDSIAIDYLTQKKDVLNQCIALTKELTSLIGDIPQTHQLLVKRKELLQKLNMIDQQFAQPLSGYRLPEDKLEEIALLAEEMWNLDDQYTEAMKSSKNDLRSSWRQ